MSSSQSLKQLRAARKRRGDGRRVGQREVTVDSRQSSSVTLWNGRALTCSFDEMCGPSVVCFIFLQSAILYVANSASTYLQQVEKYVVVYLMLVAG